MSRSDRVWTARHAGNLDLLRACLADELSEWVEEADDDPEKGRTCTICYCDRWAGVPGALPLNYRELVSWRNIKVSRIEGMTDAADKAETERALERCREAGMPGFEARGVGSYFVPTWLLPEQLKAFKRHVQRRRLDARSPATFIVKPSDGSEGVATAGRFEPLGTSPAQRPA